MNRRILTVLAAAALLVPASSALAGSRHDDPPPPVSDTPGVAVAPMVTVTVSWDLPDAYDQGRAETPLASDAGIWPQTLGTAANCGGWWQVDTWTGTQDAIDAILADGMLTHEGGIPEDHAVAVAWTFTAQPACVVEPPVVAPPVVTPPVVTPLAAPAAPPATPAVVTPAFTG